MSLNTKQMMKNKENRKGKRMQMATIKRIGETPSPLLSGNSSSRKPFNSGKKERKTKSGSLIGEKRQSAGVAEHMEQDKAHKEPENNSTATMSTTTETPTFPSRGNKGRKLPFEEIVPLGVKKCNTPRGSSSGKEMVDDSAGPMEVDAEPPNGNCIYVRKEKDSSYIPIKVEELSNSKITQAVALLFDLPKDAIKDFKLKDERRRINVKKEDGGIQERCLNKGELALVLEDCGKDSYTLKEQ